MDGLEWSVGEMIAAPPCPVCATGGSKCAELTMPDGRHLVRCQCGARYWRDHVSVDYAEPQIDWSIDLYVEQCGAIDSLIAPIARIPATRVSRCLEIGCGFGFSLDAAGRLFGWRCIGADPSPLAKAGKRALGVDIRNIYIDASTDLGGAFDLVYGSEVIEHVSAPAEFLSIARAHLSAGGVLVLTTPDAASISPELDASALVPILNPGHVVLYSAESLTLAAERAGFRHVRVERGYLSLLLYASDAPLGFDTAAPLDRALYRQYLNALLARDDLPPIVASGARARLFKDHVNSAEFDEATALYREIAADCQRRFGILPEPPIPTAILERVAVSDFCAPFALPTLLFHRGIIALNCEKRWEDAAAWFDGAEAAAHAFRRGYGLMDDGETGEIQRLAGFHALLALCRSDPTAAIARLDEGVSPETIERIGLTLLDLGRLDHAKQAAARLKDDRLARLIAANAALIGGRNRQAHEVFAGLSGDESVIGRRARIQDALAVALWDPAAAVERVAALRLLPEFRFEPLVVRLIDLGAIEAAGRLVDISENEALRQLMAGIGLLDRREEEKAHEALALAQRAGGDIALRAAGFDGLALARIDPDAAASTGRKLGALDPPRVESIFMRLVDLGHLRQAAELEVITDGGTGWAIVARRAILALLHHRRPAVAARLFAEAFGNAMSRASDADLWRIKYHEMQAWIMAGDASGAARAAREITAAGRDVPRDLRGDFKSLLAEHPVVEEALGPLKWLKARALLRDAWRGLLRRIGVSATARDGA